jgi:hypothetical protein
MATDVRKLPIQRGTSPAVGTDNANNRSWGANQGVTDPKQALNNKYNEREINPTMLKDK